MTSRIILPLSALLLLITLHVLVIYQWIPSGLSLLEIAKERFGEHVFLLIALIILLESIVYIGFYFPGQFFAVLLVVLSKPTWIDIIYLTFAMVVAATIGSMINYGLGAFCTQGKKARLNVSIRSLVIAMIHINSLAFFMFNQGAQRSPFHVVLYAALLNLPYYLLLIIATTLLSQQVVMLAENTWLLIFVVAIWLIIAVITDFKQRQNSAIKS